MLVNSSVRLLSVNPAIAQAQFRQLVMTEPKVLMVFVGQDRAVETFIQVVSGQLNGISFALGVWASDVNSLQPFLGTLDQNGQDLGQPIWAFTVTQTTRQIGFVIPRSIASPGLVEMLDAITETAIIPGN